MGYGFTGDFEAVGFKLYIADFLFCFLDLFWGGFAHCNTVVTVESLFSAAVMYI